MNLNYAKPPLALGPLRFALAALPMAWLWFVLINDLRVEWTVNAQYSYGWAVPFLCAFLIWQKAEKRKTEKLKGDAHSGVSDFQRVRRFQLSSFSAFQLFLLSLLYAPTRLIQEANPGWRLISWALALEVIGITLCLLWLAQEANAEKLKTEKLIANRSANSGISVFQHFRFSDFLFPSLFFLVAVPWPTAVEQGLIQGLTRADAATAVEILGLLGIPAMPHGNVIEIATGTVGIDEACSGIRSFQATLMISLFLGEYYRLSVVRRIVLCLSGFALSFIFNLARMTLLVWVAAHEGIGAIAKWHDPAGVTILLVCFFGLWGLGTLLGKAEKLKTETLKRNSDSNRLRDVSASQHFRISAFALSAWLLLTELSVEGWYRWHEMRLPPAVTWTLAWPTNNPTFKELPLAARTREILRYDEGHSVAWQENDALWQAVFLRWNPGRTALHLAQNHTPEVCMTAAGHNLKVVAEQEWIEVGAPISKSAGAGGENSAEPGRTGVRRSGAGTNTLRLPFAIYEVADAERTFYVFYCLWSDRASGQGFETMSLNYGNRLAPVLQGLRNPGQRSVEIAVVGPNSADEAEAAVRAMLNQHLRIEAGN